MRLLFLLLTCVSALAQGGSYCTMTTWEPRNLVTKAGLVASYDPGNTATETFNPAGYAAGNGVSQMLDRAMSIRTGNLLLQSETFSTTWTPYRLKPFGATDTGATNAGSFANTSRTTDPLGSNTADFIQEDDTAANTHGIRSSQYTITAGTYTLSVFAKADVRTNVFLSPNNSVGTGSHFNLQTGTKTSDTGGAAGAITAFPNGWYLCSSTKSLSAGSDYCAILMGSANNVNSYSGNGTDGIFIWGASLVKSDWTPVTGATLAQGYQVTTTAAYAPPDLVQSTAANQPKISRTDNAGNLMRQSEDFGITWSLTRCNAFNNSGSNLDTGAAGEGSHYNTARTLDPLGGNTADFIQEDATASDTHFIFQIPLAITPSTTNTFSVFAKRDTSGLLTNIMIRDFTTGVGKGFDLYSASAVAVSGISAPLASSIVTDASWNGFYKCSITFVSGAGANIRINTVTNSAGTYTATYSGDNTKGVFLWGASLVSDAWTPVTGTSAALGYVATTTVPIFPGLGGRAIQYYDGSAYYMKTAAFPLIQPEEVYLLCNQWTWTDTDGLFDGLNLNSMRVVQHTATPTIHMYAGAYGPNLSTAALGSWCVLRCGFVGASSYFVQNMDSPATGDPSTGNGNGFTLGANATPAGYGNLLAARTLICNKTNAPAEANYLRWGLLKQAGLY